MSKPLLGGIGMSLVDEARNLAADLIDEEGKMSGQVDENQETHSEEEYKT